MTDTSRRTLIEGIAVAGVALPLLAACGGSTTPAKVQAGAVPSADIPVGGGKVFGDQGYVVTQPVKGQFKAFSSTCTHAGCTVSDPEAGVIPCHCHGSEYSITDGSVVRGPAPAALAAVPVKVAGTELDVG